MGREQAVHFLVSEGYVSSPAAAEDFISSARQASLLGQMSPYAAATQFAEQRAVPVAVALADANEQRGRTRLVPRILRDLVGQERGIMAEITELQKQLSEREAALASARGLAIAVVNGREARQNAISEARDAYAQSEQKLAVLEKRLTQARDKVARKAKGFAPAASVAEAASIVGTLELAVAEMKSASAERGSVLKLAEEDAAAFEKQHGKDLELVEGV